VAYLLGIDQGTTQTTAVVLDEGGRVVAARSAHLPARFPQPGRVEQEPADILSSVREAAAPLAQAYPISAAGFDNQGETFLLWERASGRPVTPAIVWQDQRGAGVCQGLADQVETGWLRRKTGLLLDSYFSAPKLRYVFETDPALLAEARAGRLLFGTTETWALWNLSGGRLHVTDPSTAARTLLFDINRLEWDDDLLALFGVPRGILPEVRPSAGLAGAIDLGAGPLPLHALLVDQTAALFGQACFQPGDMKCTFGTGSFLLMNTGGEPRLSSRGLLSTVAWQVGGQAAYALDGGIFVTGAAVQWLAQGLGILPDPAASAEAARRSADAGVTFVPALAGLAAPHWRTDVRGALFGLSRATTPADIARAALDGIAWRVVEVAEAMRQDAGQSPAQLRVDGGPTANSYLMQTLADCLDLEVQVAAAREATAIGAAALAAHSAHGVGLDELRRRWRPEAAYQPRLAASERAERRERWQRAVAAVKLFHAGA
jgi:glycerol kinase